MMWQPGKTLEECEFEVLLAALRFYHGNRTRAADALKISIRTMTNRVQTMRERKIEVPKYIGPGGVLSG
jgi:DNA-binding NtrC family response regulator